MGLSQERRPWKESNATCARPLREALPSCRGLRARHAQKECIGSWEVPRLTSGNVTPWPASGRRGAEADDARTGKVGLCRKSCEAGEQGGAIRCGVGGAKGGDQGECGSAKHAPGSGTGKCVTGAGTHTEAAKQRKKEKFTTLFHHISVGLLRLAFFEIKKDAAPGADGLTWQDYEADLDRRIEDLHDRVHRGAYRAQPSRRRFIPKPDGRQRPLAIAALEDKIVQRAVVMVLNAIYEEDFLGLSYGFRPGRSQHDALDALVTGIGNTKVNWILDADIRSFFDMVSQEWLVKFVEHRVGDRRIIRLIQKWLKAGILEDEVVTVSARGTAQGWGLSPLVA